MGRLTLDVKKGEGAPLRELMGESGRGGSSLHDESGGRIGRYIADYLVRIRKEKFLLFLALPGVIYFVIFRYVPLYGILMAFKDYSIRDGILGSPWAGLSNFAAFFEYPYALRLIRNTFLLSFYQLLFGFPAPIIMALLLNEVRNETYRKTVQTISFFPHFLTLPAIVGMFFMILSPNGGFVNVVLTRVFGMKPIYFMLEPGWFRPVFVVSGIWQSMGWGAIVYLAQLSRIDPQLYEAATVEGCTRLQKIRHISLPGLKPIISILLILRMGQLMSVGWQKVILMYNPMTYETADVIGSFVYRRGLVEGAYSLGTAVGFLNSLVALLLVTIANSVAKRISEWTVW